MEKSPELEKKLEKEVSNLDLFITSQKGRIALTITVGTISSLSYLTFENYFDSPSFALSSTIFSFLTLSSLGDYILRKSISRLSENNPEYYNYF